MANNLNEYTGPLTVGSDDQFFKMSYDTQLGFNVLLNCTASSTCPSSTYSKASSTATGKAPLYNWVEEQGYIYTRPDNGGLKLTGKMYDDQMLANVNVSSIYLDFFLSENWGTNQTDGSVGLAPSNAQSSGPSFVDFLYMNGRIPEKMLSWSLGVLYSGNTTFPQSTVAFGAGQNDAYNGSLYKHEVMDGHPGEWALNLSNVFYETENNTVFNKNNTVNTAIIATSNDNLMTIQQ